MNPSTPEHGALGHIRSIFPELIPSEQRVAREILAYPAEVSVMSGADLAERTGTSAATVSRACRNLGFDSFQELKMFLIRETLFNNYIAVESTDDDGIARYAQSTASTIADMFIGIDEEAFHESALALAQAERIVVIASGGSVGIAQLFQFRFLAAGIVCEAPEDPHLQMITAKTMTSRDVCLVISQSGSNSVSLYPAEIAKGQGATVIGVTSYANSPITRIAHHTIRSGASLPPNDPGSVIMNTVNMLLTSFLQLEVFKHLRRDGNELTGMFSSSLEFSNIHKSGDIH